MTSSIPPSRPTFQLGQYTVHRVGFGAMQLPGPGVFGPPRDHDQAIADLDQTVLTGKLVDLGMPNFAGKLNPEDVEKIKAFIAGTADAVRPK